MLRLLIKREGNSDLLKPLLLGFCYSRQADILRNAPLFIKVLRAGFFFHHLQPDWYKYEGNVLHDLFGSCSSLNIVAAGENFFG